MVIRSQISALALCIFMVGAAHAQTPTSKAEGIPVTPDNFMRAETDMYFGNFVKDGALGKFIHTREPASIDNQTVIRMNRDTLYSFAAFDLDAGPVTVTLPDAGKRFRSVQVVDQDQFTPRVIYKSGTYTFTRKEIGTRYMALLMRTLVDPADPEDVKKVHVLQDGVRVTQNGPGKFEVPNWDQASHKKVREALLVLASTMKDFKGSFGPKGAVDPVHRLIGAAAGWGGNPDKDATYVGLTPEKNDGKTIYKLNVKDVPVDAFWSISVYNAQGYFEKNPQNAYTINNITAKRELDGSVNVQFGGCDGKIVNCLPITNGWNYLVRLYRPRAEILSGKWTFPEAKPAN
ncbi:DUF1254 domain-containing protein [Bosea sp. NBC_00550]|uniref:DUF1254 domain-containing protein n=1 Tax=Bosea sp. NBC_00550 TaxID=2969621 RepID=UPI00222FCDA1|nr:DUF1254 domain-containing protein [Bosea sp. NBC_00550]UZF94005.1 DUF1254 domain-containing protein [Bosea sp. NBC_00550]